ncbi:MAG: hypothetical protein GXP25_10135 [Planctomycetes bacterium]|nr:hypothetical protein [Planctomycetota bacterium]
MNERTARKEKRTEQGIALIETMIAAVVFAFGILALVSAISSTVVVDAITQENDAALDTARQVIEQIKSASFSDLENKITELEPVADALDYIPYPSSNGAYGEGGDYYYNPYEYQLEADPDYQNSLFVEQDTVTDWYGNSVARDLDTGDYDPDDNLYKQPSVVIDHFGNFMVKSPKIGELSPWGGLPTAGRVRIQKAWEDANGNGIKDAGEELDDVIEVTVAIRWNGQKGLTQKILRSQIADWEEN